MTPDWAHQECGGTNWIDKHCKCRGEFHVCEAPFVTAPCPGPHAGPFLVDGERVWADPEKVVWRCAKYGDVNEGKLNSCVGHHGFDCGFYPIGGRLTEAEETDAPS